MYAFRIAHSPVALHNTHLQPVVFQPSLSPRDTRRLMNTIIDNRSLAHEILSHIKTIDPKSISLRKERQQEIMDYCNAVCDYQTLSNDVAAGTHRSHHTGSFKPPSPLLPKHVELAQKDRAMLNIFMSELAHVSKMVREDARGQLEQSMRTLQRLAKHMTVEPPVLRRAAEFLSLLGPRHHNAGAFKLERDRDLEALRTLKSRVEECCRALELVKPFADAGAPKGRHRLMDPAYLNHLKNAKEAAVERDWSRLYGQLDELEAIASLTGHVPAVPLSQA